MKIFIFSGAGLDAESGVPTFRDANGLWENHDIMDVCHIQTFRDNYELVHKFYSERRKHLNAVEPNSAHHKIAELSKTHEVLNFTANVSDLLERAGCEDVKHIHGYLPEVRINYGRSDEEIVDIGYTEHELVEGRWDKPNVVFFGESAPLYTELYRAIDSLGHNDVAIVVGSTLEVNPIHYDIAMTGCRFILINPTGETEDGLALNDAIRLCDKFIQLPATEAFKDIEKYL